MRKEIALKIFILFLNLIVIIRLFDISIIKHDFYLGKSSEILNSYFYGPSAPRGRILDKKGRILVDNKGIKVLTFKKNSKTDLHVLCVKLAQILDMPNISVSPRDKKKYFYFANKEKVDALLDSKMIDKYKSSLITATELEEYKHTFISDSDIEKVSDKEVYIYNLLNSGYSFSEKIIKSDISEEENASINELGESSLEVNVKWVRHYNYDTVLNQLFGTIGAIDEERVNELQESGYSLDDTVGTTFLEKYYEEYLKGNKAIYKIEDGEIQLVQEETRGYDLVLGIDIDEQIAIENMLKEEIENAKKYPSSKYFKGSYVVVSEPKTGLVKALAGFDANNNYSPDVIGILTNSYTVGSVVKGASQSVAFINGVIDKNKQIVDSCVKLKNMPSKCSWARLGSLNDIDALAKSSNYYQFINAIKVAGKNYTYDMIFNPTIDDFNKYRSVFRDYGLGSLSGIDLGEEKLGITGSRISGDLLLNYAIGQYDTYTPLMLSSYINTIANDGERLKLRLVDYAIDNNGNRSNINESQLLNRVGIDIGDLKRIQEGLRKVVSSGTASGYVDYSFNAAGKTGTSETFYNGIPTTTRSFIMYAPTDEPKYSMVIVSPNLATPNATNNYKYPINSRLSRKISYFLFEK